MLCFKERQESTEVVLLCLSSFYGYSSNQVCGCEDDSFISQRLSDDTDCPMTMS